jgi:hypothetical protein
MNPTKIIERAAEDGVLLALSPSGGISAKGAQSAIDRWLPALRQSKAEIVLLLRPGGDGWSVEDWQVFLDERAGIAEFDGSLPRLEAEARAFACCVVEWLKRNFVRSPPGRCLACRGGDQARDPLLPHGIEPTRRAGLHSRCWPAWHAGRKSEAVAALAAIGDQAADRFSKRFRKKGRRINGRHRIGTAERVWTRYSRNLSLDRCEPAAPRRMPAFRLVGRLAMDAGRRACRRHRYSGRRRSANSVLSYPTA